MERDDPTPEPDPPPDWTSTSTPHPYGEHGPAEAPERPRLNLWDTVGDVTPWGTMFLILSWVAVFGLMLWRGDAGDARAMVLWGANLAQPGGAEFSWRLLASTFIHANLAHLFFNALSQAIMGPAVERIFTPPRFWLLFATGAVVSGWASAEWRSGHLVTGVSVSVGASGAIFALGGAVLVSAWRLRHRLVPGRARALAGSLLILLVNGLVSGMTRDGTDNIAHLAGLVWGMAAGLVLGIDPRLSGKRPSRWVLAAGVISAAALCLALVNGVVSGLAMTGPGP